MLAHGIGNRSDLPLPLPLFTLGVLVALVASFIILGIRWTEPRLAEASAGRALVEYRVVQVSHWVGRIAAFALYLVCLYAGFFGLDARDRNILPVTLYVVVWIGAPTIGGLIGDLWAAINPIDTLARLAEGLSRLLGRVPGAGPAFLGHWPATLGIVIFLFYELTHPTGADPRTLARLLAVHAAFTVVTGFLWGAKWVTAHEPFSVFFAKVANMAPLYRSEDGGMIRVRWPMSGLSRMAVLPGTAALLLVTIGGTSFDGFSESAIGRDIFGNSVGRGLVFAELSGLAVSIALVTLLYVIGVLWMTRVTDIDFASAWREFTPSLVPIAFGYAVAHYFRLLVDETQSFVFRLSDPFGQGWDLFGGSDGLIWRINLTVVAWIQVSAILVGHVGAVMVAHDRSLELFPPVKSLQSQFAMLFVMVAYSTIGLWLLLTA
jgi:hypothetical protein